MGSCYFELRIPSTLKTAIGNDVAAHLQARQFLGSTIIVCERPFAMVSVVRKAWQKMVRQTQNDRARTLNAEEILRFTRRAIQMQQLQFTISNPETNPCADVYFVTPEMLSALPAGCYTIYLTCPVTNEQLKSWTASLLDGSLIVNYDVGVDIRVLGFRPKQELEMQFLQSWAQMLVYLKMRGVHWTQLDTATDKDPSLNDVLDVLLGRPGEFTELAIAFQHQLDLAQPLTTVSDKTQARIAVVLKLAHRVQALSPVNPHLKQIFGSTETFFLRDRSAEQLSVAGVGLLSC